MAVKKISAQRFLPFCAFVATFTIVMTILVCSTDMRTRRYHRLLNLSLESDFQNVAQEDPQLIAFIREHHLRPPPRLHSKRVNLDVEAIPEIGELFGWKKGGVFVEGGAYRHNSSSETEWLERALQWRGLLIQPDPQDFRLLLSRNRTRSHAANVCLSPTPNPKQVSFREVPKNVSDPQLTKVHCFPLYSLLLAYNTTTIDFLSLKAEKAELQVLKTLPFSRVRIKVISVLNPPDDKQYGNSLLVRLMRLLSVHGYKLNRYASINNRWVFVCSRGYSGCSALRVNQ
ncbi:protein Star-like [Homalodisca vitripennis]|nr:protein Star-like [Homalodisca vitripennis]KAG8275381.1 hypothetical protein J6590_087550 [Homalodisca vitripennis]